MIMGFMYLSTEWLESIGEVIRKSTSKISEKQINRKVGIKCRNWSDNQSYTFLV